MVETLIDAPRDFWIVGGIGTDAFGTPNKRPQGKSPGRKYPVLSHREFTDFLTEYGLRDIPYEDKYPGTSPGNLATGMAKVVDSQVVLFTTLSPTDQSTDRLIAEMAAPVRGIKMFVTPNTSETNDAYNPVSVILPPYTNPIIVSFKPDNAPPIEVKPDEGTPLPRMLVSCASNGKWEETIYNTAGVAKQHNIPYAVFATENQIKQIVKPGSAREAYFSQIRGETAPNDITFVGNLREAAMVVRASGRRVDRRSPYALAMQLKEASEGNISNVSITRGKNGSVYLDENNVLHSLSLSSAPDPEVFPIINGFGMGDAYGAVFLAGQDSDPERRTKKAAEAAYHVMGKRDAQSGQMRRGDFLAEPLTIFEYRATSPRSQAFPIPHASSGNIQA